MARAKTSDAWVERIREIVENDPSLKLRAIEQRLAEIAAERDERDIPSERTIRRIRKEHLERSEAERRPYRYVRWPDSFESGELPWAAAPAMLREFARRHLNRETEEGRPTVRWARRYWQLLQSVPDADEGALRWLRAIARHLASYDVLGGPPAGEREAVEGWLALRAWEGGESSENYEDAVALGRVPRWDQNMVVRLIHADLDDGRYVEALGERLDLHPEVIRRIISRVPDGAIISALPPVVYIPDEEGELLEDQNS